MADDADGPSNNHIHYAIIDGNQGNPFTIDPTRGEIKVTKLLDREKVSFLYLLSSEDLIRYLFLITTIFGYICKLIFQTF